MTKEIKKQSLLLLIIAVTVIYMIINILITDAIFLPAHLIAIGLVIVNIGMFIISKKIYKYTLFITLILGVFNIISFTTTRLTIGLSINNLNITLQPFSLGLLIFFIFIYQNDIKEIKRFLAKNKEKREWKQEQIREEETKSKKEYWKRKYRNKTGVELKRMSEMKDGLVPEAWEAVIELLESKNSLN
jgi:hypothetical protein